MSPLSAALVTLVGSLKRRLPTKAGRSCLGRRRSATNQMLPIELQEVTDRQCALVSAIRAFPEGLESGYDQCGRYPS
jgi:hypothetical protein